MAEEELDDMEKLTETETEAESESDEITPEPESEESQEPSAEETSIDEEIPLNQETLLTEETEPGNEIPEPGNINPVDVNKVQFESFDNEENNLSESLKLNLLLDIAVDVAIELGRTRMLIKDVLNLGVGSIVELNKLAGEPVDLLVNNKKFAEGEVVVIDENFGIRITNLVKIDHFSSLRQSLNKKF